MNILILNWRDIKSPQAGGAEIVTHEYAKAWIKAGHRVTWFSSMYPGAKERESIDTVHIVRRGSMAFGVQIAAWRWYIFQKEQSFDLVIDQFHGIPFFTPLYVKAKKLAFIHEVAKEVWKFNPWPKPLNLFPYIVGSIGEPLLFRLLYRHTPFLTVSESTKKDLVQWGIPVKNITVIHNGVHIPSVQKIQKEKIKTLIYLGALSEDKGIFDAIRAFANILRFESDWQFWIVGNGDTKIMQRLLSLCTDLGIKKNVRFWGFVTEKEKYILLARAHILINTSIREGWGLVILEAAGQRTPAVVYDVPGLHDSVQDGKTGVVVKENNPEALAIQVIALLNDKKRYTFMQNNARFWANSLTWEKATRKSLTLISKMC